MSIDEPYSRNSNALRASVLDAALQLGIGSSRTVENWMFNSVAEEDELEHAPTPGLTSASTATSEESSPSFSARTAAGDTSFVTGRPDAAYTEGWKAHIAHPQDALPSVALPSTSPAKAASKAKLRKQRKDGYESDGGYISESGKKDKDKAKKKEKKEKKSKKAKETDGAETEVETDGGQLSDVKKKKSKKEKKSRKEEPSTTDGYDTSDGGYLSEASGGKKKRSFFRLGSKSKKSASSPSDSSPPAVPPLPPMPNIPLPIADRFATSPAPSSFDLEESSRSVTPIGSYLRNTDSPVTRMGSGGSLSDMLSGSNVGMSTPPLSLRSPTPSGRPSQQSQGSMDSVLSSPVSAPAGSGPRVRFTPSTRFDGPLSLPPSPPGQTFPEPPAPRRPQISLPLTSTLSPPMQPSPLSSPRSTSPQPFLARALAPRKQAPTPLWLPAPTSPLPTTPSPVPSDYTVVPSADFIVPSPSFPSSRRSIATNNPRAHFASYDLPPPSPPPQGPLPSVPSDAHLDPSRMPLPYSPGPRSASPSPGPRAASPLFAQPIPAIQRGRETPFPARPVLPPQESSALVRRTTTAARNVVWKQQREGVPDILINVEDATDDGGSVIRADTDFDPSMRPDVAQFYFSHEVGTAGRASPYGKDAESVYQDDERSLYPDDARTLETYRRRSAVDSYYFDSEAGQQRMSVWSRRASFMDDEKSGEVRSRLIAKVGAMREAEEIPPVPKIRPF